MCTVQWLLEAEGWGYDQNTLYEYIIYMYESLSQGKKGS